MGSPFVAIRAFYYVILCWLLIHLTACFWWVIPCSNYNHVAPGRVIHEYCNAPSWVYSGMSTESTSTDAAYKVLGFHNYQTPVPNKNIYAGIFDHGQGSHDYLISLPDNQDFVRLNATVGKRYFYALYWTVTTMTSVG